MSADSTARAAGWYDDPERPDQLRWWNGVGWSDHWHPRTPGAEPTTGAAPAVPAVPAVPASVPLANASGTNGKAIAAAILPWVLGIPGGIAAIVLGGMALKEIERTGQGGATLARIGRIVGFLQLALVALVLLALGVPAFLNDDADTANVYDTPAEFRPQASQQDLTAQFDMQTRARRILVAQLEQFEARATACSKTATCTPETIVGDFAYMSYGTRMSGLAAAEGMGYSINVGPTKDTYGIIGVIEAELPSETTVTFITTAPNKHICAPREPILCPTGTW